MTTTLERLTSLRLLRAVVAAAVAALFIVAAAGMASADGNYGNYGGSSNYPSPEPPGGEVPPRTPRVVGSPSFLPVTGGDALGLAALGVTVAGVGAGFVVWSRKRSAVPADA